MKTFQFVPRFFLLSCALIALMGFSPLYGQINGAYSDGSQYHVFTSEGEYHIFDFNNDESFSGSYELDGGMIYFFNNRGRLTASCGISSTRTALILSDGNSTYRLKYVGTPEDFIGAALIGASLMALFGN